MGALPELRGLDSAEARRRLAVHGPNTLPEAPPQRAWVRWLRQFRSPLVALLVLAVFVDIAVWLHDGGHGAPVEAIIIAIVLALNASLAVLQEWRSEAALHASRNSRRHRAGFFGTARSRTARAPSWCPATWCVSKPASACPPTRRCSRRRGSQSTSRC